VELPEAPVSELLAACRRGDGEAFDRLVAVVYEDLRRLARRQRRRPGSPPTLQTTALVHEAYLKLAGGKGLAWADRAHFLAVATRAMRHILVDHAKALRREKRGGGAIRVDLAEEPAGETPELEKLIAVHEALDELAAGTPRSVRVVECRYFAGMSTEETATALGLSPATVERDWRRARRELRRLVTGSES
jgi:RNA polymerase sigma factor (TIGR02999 family)